MAILALEFSSPRRSVAVAAAGGVLGEVIETGAGFQPGNLFRPAGATGAFRMIEAVLREAKLAREQIEILAIGLGPGSYTGVRAALALAQGWRLARETKLLGVSSIEAIAAQAQSEKIFGRAEVVIDAQRDEFYLARYEITANGWGVVEPLKILTLAEVKLRAGVDGVLVGPEVTRWFPDGRTIFPSAATLARLVVKGEGLVSGEKLEPIYLRETNFVKTVPRKSDAG